IPYPELDKKNLEWSKSVVEKEYYTRTTDRKTFITKDLIVYDKKTDTYKAVDPPSERLLLHMLNCIPEAELQNFKDFIKYHYFN
ncbi:MAG: hypothetical protein IJ583_00605, partial [Firmicutes bacterium]|nr:hypothetical protein [Bacillota bacterium]